MTSEKITIISFVFPSTTCIATSPQRNKKHRLLAGFVCEEGVVFNEFKPECHEPMLDTIGQIVGAVDALAFHHVGDVMCQIVVKLLERQRTCP
jgi:hypothetical protein